MTVFVSVENMAEGAEETLLTRTAVELGEEDEWTVFAALLKAVDGEVGYDESEWGVFITSILGVESEGMNWWMYTVNGEFAMVGAGEYITEDQDEIVFTLSDGGFGDFDYETEVEMEVLDVDLDELLAEIMESLLTEIYSAPVAYNPETGEILILGIMVPLPEDQKPIYFEEANVLYVPIRAVADFIGMETLWDQSTKTVTILFEGMEFNFSIYDDLYGLPVIMKDNRAYIPVEYLINTLLIDWL
jgi:hypothetical protein